MQQIFEIRPELEEWYKSFQERRMKEVSNLANEMIAEGSLTIEQEELEAILNEISNRHDLETTEIANEYYNKMWDKILKKRKNYDIVPPVFRDKSGAAAKPD